MTSPTSTFDPATHRLGTYLAVVYGVQFVAHLVGIGVEGIRIELLHLLLIWAAIAMRDGRRVGRTVLVWFSIVCMALMAILLLIAAAAHAVLVALVLAFGALLFLQLVAVAFAVPAEGVALGLPERWRPWATSRALHLVLLVIGLLGVFQGRV